MENSHLYFYQELFANRVMDFDFEKGRIIIPTGNGKGVLCREVFHRMITSLDNRNNQFVGVVFSPRLLLNKQWVAAFLDYFENQSHPINFIFIGSEKISSKITEKIEKELFRINGPGVRSPVSTLKHEEVKKAVEYNKRNGINTIIISTYHSNRVVRKANLHFDCAVYDEAHFMPGRVNENGSQVSKKDLFSSVKILSRKKVFTTATEKIGEVDENIKYNGRGMNNEEIYGEEILVWRDKDTKVLRRISAKDLVDIGSMLEPRLHIVSTDPNLDSYNINGDITNISKLIF